jgi:hypothetical protein
MQILRNVWFRILIVGLAFFELGIAYFHSTLPSPTSVTAIPTIPAIPSNTPSPTPSLFPTETSTPNQIAAPVCHPGHTIMGILNPSIPGYLNILKAKTHFEGKLFLLVLTLREIPDEITINSDNIEEGMPELAWGVTIFNDPKSDDWDYKLQSFTFKHGPEQTGSILTLFREKTYVWSVNKEAGGTQTIFVGTLSVDKKARTITLRGLIPGISSQSFLEIFAYSKYVADQLCIWTPHSPN